MKIKKYVVAIITAICLLFLAYISSWNELKYNFITSNAPFFVFFIYLINSDKIVHSNKNILLWSSAIVFITIAVALIQVF